MQQHTETVAAARAAAAATGLSSVAAAAGAAAVAVGAATNACSAAIAAAAASAGVPTPSTATTALTAAAAAAELAAECGPCPSLRLGRGRLWFGCPEDLELQRRLLPCGAVVRQTLSGRVEVMLPVSHGSLAVATATSDAPGVDTAPLALSLPAAVVMSLF